MVNSGSADIVLAPTGHTTGAKGNALGIRGGERTPALKGRTRAAGRLVRPFRASTGVCVTGIQGVALRSGSTPRWGGRRSVGRTAKPMTNLRRCCMMAAALTGILATSLAWAIESPTSDGPIAILDEPSIRLPLMKKPPAIDGAWSEGEWEDASGLSGFWCTNIPQEPYPAYQHLAPHQTQSRIYAGYDKEHLYLAYVIQVYPEDAWLKARGRFPDVYHHPLYGIIIDDHIEFELRPYHDLTQGYKWGMYKWFANPLAVISDQHWSLSGGEGKKWQSKAYVRAGVTRTYWVVEMRVPLVELRHKGYAGKDPTGQDVVKLPPPDGTTYRCWFKNGIGGFSRYVILWDRHVWNTTKARLVLDSQTVGFQLNDLGPFMEDIIDVKMTLKNHNTRSETVRVGFFMENAEGLIFSSYEDENTKDGIIELIPGEVKKIRFRKKFPGLSKQDNFLWLDVRTAGRPAKVIFRNRLGKFHSVDPGPPYHIWRECKLDTIARMRPPKMDFDFKYQYSPYTNKLSGFVDRGIYGASEEAKTAVEAKLTVMEATEDEKVVAEKTSAFQRDFATFLFELPKLKRGEYKVSLLLFDKNKRIVGERNPDPFSKSEFPWERNTLGLEDVVWEPFEPIELEGNTLETIKHVITIDPSGLPAQIAIKPDLRELPLEKRADPTKMTETELAAIGRGPQLRAPLRLEAVVNGQRATAEVVEPFTPVRQWKSELELASKLRVGALEMELHTQYDCDGALTVKLTYGAEQPVEAELLELVMDVAGPVDQRVGGAYGMQPASGMEMTLPDEEGLVWDSANDEHLEPFSLYYTKFVPFLYFGNGDRGWSWLADRDEQWVVDQEGSTMTLERDKYGQVTWRVKFVNHKATITGKRTLEFVIFTHPAKPKDDGYRRIAWLDWPPQNYGGIGLKCIPNDGPFGIDGSDGTFKYFLRRYPNGAPRLYINSWLNSGIPEMQKRAYTGVWRLHQNARVNSAPIDSKGGYGQPWIRPGRGNSGSRQYTQSLEDYTVYHCERMIRIGRVPGYWWDELHPPVRTECVASGGAFFRKPSEVKEGELPWQAQWASLNVRNMYKRLARLLKQNDVPNYNSFWAGSSTTYESYARDSELRESAAAFSKTYEIDNVTRFPISFFRYCCNTHNGLYTRVQPEATGFKGFGLMPGDDLRLDRALMGRVLIHDIGLAPQVNNAEQFARVLNILYDFGYFDEETTEMIPYWRSRSVCRYGEEYTDDAFEVTEEDPCAQVYVTVYRRPYKTHRGRQGYKAMFVIHNESDQPLRGRLHILNSAALFGAENNLSIDDVYGRLTVPRGLSLGGVYPWGGSKALEDLEREGAVTQGRKDERKMVVKKEIYGPIHILAHDFRILYGHYDPEVPAREPHRSAYYRSKARKLRAQREAAKGAQGWPSRADVMKQTWWKVWKEVPKMVEKEGEEE